MIPRHLRLPFVVGALTALLISCGPAYTDPETRAAAAALDAVRALTDLQNAAIAASETGGLPSAQAVLVVKFTTAGIRTVQQTPYGWGPSVQAGWTEVKAQVGMHPSLRAHVPVIDALLAALGGTR